MHDPKNLVHRFMKKLWNERRLDVADAIFAEDCVTHPQDLSVTADRLSPGDAQRALTLKRTPAWAYREPPNFP
jgi:hypothetical protein